MWSLFNGAFIIIYFKFIYTYQIGNRVSQFSFSLYIQHIVPVFHRWKELHYILKGNVLWIYDRRRKTWNLCENNVCIIHGVKTDAHKRILKQNSENNLVWIAQWFSSTLKKGVVARMNSFDTLTVIITFYNITLIR